MLAPFPRLFISASAPISFACYCNRMSASGHTPAQDKHATIVCFAEQLRSTVTDLLGRLPDTSTAQSADPHEDYVALLQDIAAIRDACTTHIDLVSTATHCPPHPLPIARIAQAAGVSVNTVRSRMPAIKQGRDTTYPDPF